MKVEDEKKDKFLRFNYPELKDLGKHFLTISSGTAVIVITFSGNLNVNSNSENQFFSIYPILALIIAIMSAGTGLLTNYIAGSGANMSGIWGFGKNYRFFTVLTYIFYLTAGAGLLSAYAVLALALVVE